MPPRDSTACAHRAKKYTNVRSDPVTFEWYVPAIASAQSAPPPSIPALNSKTLLSPPELAAHLSVSVKTVYNMVARGQIPASAIRHVGRRLRFLAAEIKVWLTKRHVASQQETAK